MTTRDRSVVMVLGLLAMVAAFWFLLLSPKKDEVASLKDSISTAQTRLSSASATVRTASAAKATYAADYRAVANLGKAVPADDDVPSLVFQLQNASVDSRIAFDSIKLTGSSAPATATPAAATTTAQVGQLAQEQKGATTSTGAAAPTTSTPTTAAGATTPAAASPVAAAQTAFAGLPPGASVGSAGLPTMPFEFDFSGPFLRLEQLLRKIDGFTRFSGGQIKVNGRLMTIDSISLTGFPNMTAVIHATAFVLPDAQGLMGGATPTGPSTAVNVSSPATPSTGAPVTPVAAATPAAGVTP